MPRNVRVFQAGLHEGTLKLEPDAAHYITVVHRLRQGDAFTLFDPSARLEADAVLLLADVKRASCSVSGLRSATNVSALNITLIQGIGKADKPEQVLRSATALGASAIALVETERSVLRVGDRAHSKSERWQAVLIDAARQCGRGDLPELRAPVSLESELERVRNVPGLKLCLHPDGDVSFASASATYRSESAAFVLIGPEGGLSEAEVAAAQTAGFAKVRFGSFTLRTELACSAVLGALVARADLEP